ncbi:UNVERIFIED_CONTAM: hypothetical protein Sradi_1500600 [Sesamum radiatum]|uniref:Uncharacterized protein n=1 Tax=Sesamum radiatum TaxID=300843 RepID=A0AAW2U726_SESRA
MDIHHLHPWAQHIIIESEASQLMLHVTKDYVKATFFDIDEDKSPGTDGYSARFYKAAWPMICEEVTRAVLDFFVHGRILKQVNATLLALIPKVQSSTTVANFKRNVLYKGITKILVQQIRILLDAAKKMQNDCKNIFSGILFVSHIWYCLFL